MLAVADAILGGEMEYRVRTLDQREGRGIADVNFMKLDCVRNLLPDPVRQVVNADDPVSLCYQPVGEIASNETGHAGDNDRRLLLLHHAMP